MIAGHLIVIGAMKAGTTSLYTALRDHPDLVRGPCKELDHFSTSRWRGPESYAALFPDPPARAVVTLDASPSYAKLYPSSKVPGRIASLTRPVHLVYLLRDPLERAISHVRHNINRGRVSTAALGKLDLGRYARASLYSRQIEIYHRAGLADRLLLLDFGTLCRDPNAAVAAVCRHAGLAPHGAPQPVRANVNPLPADAADGLDLDALREALRGERHRMIRRHGFAPARGWTRLGRAGRETPASVLSDPAA